MPITMPVAFSRAASSSKSRSYSWSLTLGELKRGEWRDLTPEEIEKLRELDV